MRNAMGKRGTHRRLVEAVAVVGMALATTESAMAQWPQWGGPNRDFMADAKNLASSWPKEGPKQIWSRPLGSGYSSISVQDGALYTMYRDGDDEIVVALNADDGKTVWEHRYAALPPEGVEKRFGIGPHSTPLVHGDRVYTLSFNGLLQCLNRADGKVAWSHDLIKDFGAKVPEFGFSSSPIVYKDTLIAAVGGKGCGIMAFDLKSGSIAWKSLDLENLYSSPIIINIGGEDQVVVLSHTEIVGASPKNGGIRWRFPHENQWKTNIVTPLWGKDGLLYLGSGGDAGSRALKFTRSGAKTKAEEVWANRKMRMGHGNAVRIGDYIYGVSGYNNAATITAIHAGSGEIAWQEKERGYSSGTLVYGDGKLILLKDNGTLALMSASPKGLDIKSDVALLKETAWAMPTLVGDRLYVRDAEKIMALDLG